MDTGEVEQDMIDGKPPPPTGCPATCEGLPEQCPTCPLDCYAAGPWSMEPFDDGPEVWTGPGVDGVVWERMIRGC